MVYQARCEQLPFDVLIKLQEEEEEALSMLRAQKPELMNPSAL